MQLLDIRLHLYGDGPAITGVFQKGDVKFSAPLIVGEDGVLKLDMDAELKLEE